VKTVFKRGNIITIPPVKLKMARRRFHTNKALLML
jgi:hypothetical protein